MSSHPGPLPRPPGELGMEHLDLSQASDPEFARAQGLINAFDSIKAKIPEIQREQLAAYICDGSWKRLAAAPSSLEAYKKLRGNAGRRKVLWFPYWFEVASYFTPNHPTLQPIREELSEIWGVDLPKDRVHYPWGVDAKRARSAWDGKKYKPKFLKPDVSQSTSSRSFTPINKPETPTPQRSAKKKVKFNLTTASSPTPDKPPASADTPVLPQISSTDHTEHQGHASTEKAAGSPTLTEAKLTKQDWQFGFASLRDRVDKIKNLHSTPTEKTELSDLPPSPFITGHRGRGEWSQMSPSVTTEDGIIPARKRPRPHETGSLHMEDIERRLVTI
ncbi:hypothetical protein G7Z17_g9302 [Cylindrodendrum hubeiense]|uniref:Uncharacterized protein n=1 Tax=Cylindrodendrum hubeiense TaxID=595255 RepID=A0A9P5H487_9HYPO|nr:hypothetical protein G7Z17_g9302 [Cylindrodendrum hubeiense]